MGFKGQEWSISCVNKDTPTKPIRTSLLFEIGQRSDRTIRGVALIIQLGNAARWIHKGSMLNRQLASLPLIFQPHFQCFYARIIFFCSVFDGDRNLVSTLISPLVSLRIEAVVIYTDLRLMTGSQKYILINTLGWWNLFEQLYFSTISYHSFICWMSIKVFVQRILGTVVSGNGFEFFEFLSLFYAGVNLDTIFSLANDHSLGAGLNKQKKCQWVKVLSIFIILFNSFTKIKFTSHTVN